MNVSPNVLRKETVATLKEADMLLDPDITKDTGTRATLLLAKAQCLQTLVLLNEKR